MLILDTDVLIECMRGTPAAVAWMQTVRAMELATPGIAAMEALAGCQNRADQARTETFLLGIRILWPDPSEFVLGYSLLRQHRLASGVGIADCLIAAAAIMRSEPLYTFNLRHFGKIGELDAQAPYQRT